MQEFLQEILGGGPGWGDLVWGAGDRTGEGNCTNNSWQYRDLWIDDRPSITKDPDRNRHEESFISSSQYPQISPIGSCNNRSQIDPKSIPLSIPLSIRFRIPKSPDFTLMRAQIMETRRLDQFLSFLQTDLGLPVPDVQLALRHSEGTSALLPMVLWQYGLITLGQLDQIFDWLERFAARERTIG